MTTRSKGGRGLWEILGEDVSGLRPSRAEIERPQTGKPG